MKNKELAANYIRVAQDFENLIQTLGLESTIVDMHETHDLRGEYKHPCDTPACHGGWATIMYDCGSEEDDHVFFALGADRLAQELGFRWFGQLEVWACRNPLEWGNPDGGSQFCRPEAFGEEFETTPLKLPHIPKHYRGVAGRLLLNPEKEVTWDE